MVIPPTTSPWSIDDALMEITHVVRGEDHISNTPRQILLYEALGFTAPQFAHLALVMGPDHSPLSKRHGATSVAEFRAKGYLPEALVNYLALIGWSPGNDDELLPVDELARRFSLDRVGHSAGVFDEEKLAWANRHYLKMADPARIAALVGAVFQGRGSGDDARRARPRLSGVARWRWRPRRSTDSIRFRPRLALLFDYDAAAALAIARCPRGDEHASAARSVAGALAEELAAAPRLDRERFRAVANQVKAKTGHKAQGALSSDSYRADRTR